MTRIATKPITYGSGDPPCSAPTCSIVLPIAASQRADSTVYQMAPSTKNTIAAIHVARCLVTFDHSTRIDGPYFTTHDGASPGRCVAAAMPAAFALPFLSLLPVVTMA